MRMAMAALAISRRSIAAIRRPNRVREGAAPRVAVLGIGSPFSEERRIAASSISRQNMYTRCQKQSDCLHGSIRYFAMQQ